MISVCMATYNGEKYIKEQLESILKQIGPDDEVIISDDSSKDGTLNKIKELNDNRIKVYINNGIHGYTHNFENALGKSKGDIIFLSDQDDIWMDNKVERTLKSLSTCDMAISDCITINENFEIIQQSRFEAFNIKTGFINHLIKSRFLGCCIAFNRKVLNASVPFPVRDDLIEHDIWLVAVAYRFFKVELIKEPLIYYRRHGQNISNGGFGKGYSLLNKIYRRIYRLQQLHKIKL